MQPFLLGFRCRSTFSLMQRLDEYLQLFDKWNKPLWFPWKVLYSTTASILIKIQFKIYLKTWRKHEIFFSRWLYSFSGFIIRRSSFGIHSKLCLRSPSLLLSKQSNYYGRLACTIDSYKMGFLHRKRRFELHKRKKWIDWNLQLTPSQI